MNKISKISLKIFSIGVLLTLLAGGVTLIGFIAALIIGGETAEEICTFIHKEYFPWVIRICSIAVAFGLLGMYINKRKAFSAEADKS